MLARVPYLEYLPMENWTTEEEWQDKGCFATNMKWNLAEPAVLAMTFLGLTAREM